MRAAVYEARNDSSLELRKKLRSCPESTSTWVIQRIETKYFAISLTTTYSSVERPFLAKVYKNAFASTCYYF